MSIVVYGRAQEDEDNSRNHEIDFTLRMFVNYSLSGELALPLIIEDAGIRGMESW
jgi:hypothetical protein